MRVEQRGEGLVAFEDLEDTPFAFSKSGALWFRIDNEKRVDEDLRHELVTILLRQKAKRAVFGDE